MSAPAAGDFSCSDLVKVQALATQHWSSDVRAADVTPFSEAAQAILANQTATMEVLKNPTKDRELQVTWSQICDPEVTDCGDQCDMGGAQPGSQCKEYAFTVCKETNLSIPEMRFRTSVLSKEEVAAQAMAEHVKALDEQWAQYVVSQLITPGFKGANSLTSPYTVVGDDTYIPAASWNPSLMGYFALAMATNKMRGMYMLSGANLYQAAWNAEMEQANADGKGAARKMGTFKKYFDLFNVDSVAGGNVTFLINPNAVAMFTKNYYGGTPVDYSGDNIGQKRYSIASPTLPGVRYDVYYSIKCENDEIYHQWKFITKGDVFLNPLGCESDRTGVLMFTCGEAP